MYSRKLEKGGDRKPEVIIAMNGRAWQKQKNLKQQPIYTLLIPSLDDQT